MRFRRITFRMWFLFLTLAAALSLAQDSIKQPSEYTDPDAYEVLSAILSTESCQVGSTLTVILDQTRPVKHIVSWITFEKPEHQKQWQVLAAEYDKVNGVQFKLLPRFSPLGRYTLLPQTILVGSENHMRISAVAFNEAKTLALVSTETLCGCGYSRVKLLERKNGKWQEARWPAKHMEQATCP